MKTSLIVVGLAAFASAAPTWGDWYGKAPKDGGKKYTSFYHVIATPDQVVNGTTPAPGEPGAIGYYNFAIDSKSDTICYVSVSKCQYVASHADADQDITLLGVTGDYRSAALTATHVHEAVKGASGPPRLAFPNPLPVSDDPSIPRRSTGCLSGPFKTGIVNMTTGIDSGDGFMVKQIEANPAGFFCDAHTVKYVPGVVRGQLA